MRPKFIPLTEDVMKLKNCLEEEAENAYKKLTKKITKEDYVTLVEERLGDVHNLDLTSYQEQIDAKQVQNIK